MFPAKLSKILKHQVHPFGLLVGSLAAVALLTALSGMWHYEYQLDHLPLPPSSAAVINSSKVVSDKLPSTSTHSAQASPQAATISGQNAVATNPKPATVNPVQDVATPDGSAGSAGTAGSQSVAVTPAQVEASLHINGSYMGDVTLPGGSNQCEVLSDALKAGLISYLDMRYDSQNKSYAVYVIDNIGDSSSVWWTYTVNGKSPPGCSSTPVHDGDSINWQYVK